MNKLNNLILPIVIIFWSILNDGLDPEWRKIRFFNFRMAYFHGILLAFL